jgi:pyruvate/2-oxoglutarate/acetoin dehydrogenase E1 component
VGVARAAAAASDDWSADVIDLGTLAPWDRAAVLESVARTGRLVLVEENPFTAGWGATIAAVVAAELFDELTSPVLRITAPDVPVPHGIALERAYLPSVDSVVAQVTALIDSNHVPAPWWEEHANAH